MYQRNQACIREAHSAEPSQCLQASSTTKDTNIIQLNLRISQVQRDLKKSENQFADEKSRLTSREAELLKAKADVSSHAWVAFTVHGPVTYLTAG